MENIEQIKKPCEKENFRAKIHLKNVVITLKNQILKFKIQQKMRNDTFK